MTLTLSPRNSNAFCNGFFVGFHSPFPFFVCTHFVVTVDFAVKSFRNAIGDPGFPSPYNVSRLNNVYAPPGAILAAAYAAALARPFPLIDTAAAEPSNRLPTKSETLPNPFLDLKS